MNMDIRKYILNNFEKNNRQNIEEAIDLSLKEKDDITLPGMGVFFEIIWENSNNELKKNILNILYEKFNS